MSSSNQRNPFNEVGNSDALKNQLNSFNEFDSNDALNNGLTIHEIFKDQYSAQPEAGGNALLLGTPDNYAIFPSVNTPIYQNHSAQLEAYPLQSGGVTNYAMNHGLGNVQLPHQLDQAEAVSNMVNLSMRHRMNLCRSAKPGSSQSSNISDIDMEKILKKRESDRKSRAKKEKTRKDNEEKLADVTAENKHLRKEYASLQEEQAMMKIDQEKLKEKSSHLEREVSRLNNMLKCQNTHVEAFSEKLVASSEATDLLGQNKELKRRIEQLMTESKNPDSMKIVELHEEKEKWKRKAKRLRVINEALCEKMNKDEQ